MLTIQNLSAGYTAGVTVVEEVDLAVAPGHAVGLIGRNGVGKTCLAESLLGLLPVHGGAITLGDRELTRLSARDRVRAGLSLVPEGRLVFAQLTVRENLEMAAYGAGRRLTAARFDRVCDIFPILRTKRDDRAAGMSGGEQQWLALGRALVQEPQAMVLDEPSLGLSPVAIAGLADALVAIRDHGVGIVLMEQNPHLLEQLCDDVLLLDQGRISRRLDLAGGGSDLIERAYLGSV
jgi:ABC-type branched-subunit amino acid transport system ATPase component